MLITYLKVKPRLPDDTIAKVPLIVIDCILISSSTPVNVTTMPDGIKIEQTPEGMIPLTHVAESLNAPD